MTAPGLFSFFDYPELDVHSRLAGILKKPISFIFILASCACLLFLMWEQRTLEVDNLTIKRMVVRSKSSGFEIPEKDWRIRPQNLPADLFCRREGFSGPWTEAKRLGKLNESAGFIPEPFQLELRREEDIPLGCESDKDPTYGDNGAVHLVTFNVNPAFELGCVPRQMRDAVKDYLCGGEGVAGKYRVWVKDRKAPRRLALAPAETISQSEISSGFLVWDTNTGINSMGAEEIFRQSDSLINSLFSIIPEKKPIPAIGIEHSYARASALFESASPDEVSRYLLRVTALVNAANSRPGSLLPKNRTWLKNFEDQWNAPTKTQRDENVNTFLLHIRLLLELERYILESRSFEYANEIRSTIHNAVDKSYGGKSFIGYFEQCITIGAFDAHHWRAGAEERKKFFTEKEELFNKNLDRTITMFQRLADELESQSARAARVQELRELGQKMQDGSLRPSTAVRLLLEISINSSESLSTSTALPAPDTRPAIDPLPVAIPSSPG